MNIQRFFIKAFSGIELLVALVIIAVIFLLAYPALKKVQSTYKMSQNIANLKQIGLPIWRTVMTISVRPRKENDMRQKCEVLALDLKITGACHHVSFLIKTTPAGGLMQKEYRII